MNSAAVKLLAILGVMLLGVYLDRHFLTGPRYDSLRSEYATFKGGVAAAGRAALAANAEREAKEKQDKEKADAKARKRIADLDATVRQLRDDAAKRDSRGGSASEAPAGSRCPEEQVCFERAEYQRALGEFDTEARRLVDEGSKVTADLDSAAEWAQ